MGMAGEKGCLNCLVNTGIGRENSDPVLRPNEPNTHFYQHYELLRRPDGTLWELGRGAMGVTYKARDVNLGIPVALKVIDARFAAQPEARRRFLEEAQAAAQLRHPNIASIFHFGTTSVDGNTSKGDCFCAMEFVEGQSLEARVCNAGPLSPVVALELAVQIARPLVAAERHGLVHLDLKPSNIMLTADEGLASPKAPSNLNSETWVKVIDFGLTKLNPEEGMSGRIVEPSAFTSPEQREGRKVDGRSDIYSLGVTLWYSLTGTIPDAPLPFDQLAEKNIPAPVITLLRSMLADNPDDRPHSAVELTGALQDCLEGLTGRVSAPPPRRVRHWAVLTGGFSVAAALAAAAVYFVSSSPQDKSVAVLPFRNLSTEPANAFFAEGVQDDILSRLVKIRELKVVSRIGASRYPADAPRDLGAIGRALGVRHLLEGSLRRDGDRIRLHVSLVDTRDGHEVWSEAYDHKLADAINLQGVLAQDIADTLDASLSPKEKLNVLSESTHSPDAYLLYLQGRKFEKNPGFAISAYEAAEALYRQAVAVDPGFALAHARLAMTLGLLYRYRGPSETLKAQAQAEAGEALRLQPELGEAHLAQALCYYRIERDFERALPELEAARRLLPNDTEPEMTIAFIHRRRGKWREARAAQERALTREPLDKVYEHELHATAVLLRDWPSAASHIARAIALAPKMDPLRGEQALVEIWRNGNLAPMQRIFARPAGLSDPGGNGAWARWDCAMLARDFSAARTEINSFPYDTLPSVMSGPVPKAYLEGCTRLAEGLNAQALEFFEVARPVMEAEIIAQPSNALRHARLGLLYAYMGKKADALREGERAVQLTPVSKDAIDGHMWLCNLALIHARVGDADQAISMIKRLLREPGCISPLHEASMSQWELRLRWQWDPLRGDPRFQEILAGPEPRTIF